MADVIQINKVKSLATKAVEQLVHNTENTISYYMVRQDTFDPLLVELEQELDTITVSLCGSSVDISVAGKRTVLNRAFGILRKHGFKTESKPKEGEPSYSAWWRNDKGAQIWFSFSSTQCTRVQVGTETIERAIYETRCEE